MTEECEHWLVQRRINDRYWSCVDCEIEFRPVAPPGAGDDVGQRGLGRIRLGESRSM